MYLSDRGQPLVYVGSPQDLPVLTVENYVKWYTLHVVHPGGRVKAVNFPQASPPGGGSAFVDHAPNPLACQQLAAKRGWVWDENSLDMIWGRWRREVEEVAEFDPDTGRLTE